MNAALSSPPPPLPGFIALTNFNTFSQTEGSQPGQAVWTSPRVDAALTWNELVISWNASAQTALAVEARALDEAWSSRFYHLGHWSLAPDQFPRTSVRHQKDNDGEVQTDTLILNRPARAVQLRLTLQALDQPNPPDLRFVGLSFCNRSASPTSQPPFTPAWGTILDVPQENQLAYPDGKDWCSPTCVAMVLAFWAREHHRPAWQIAVPTAARHIHDPAWGGTGNWSFNTAFAGSLPGMRAYVTRLPDLTAVERWINAGYPVVLSVSFDLLNDTGRTHGTGHLVVCVGFTERGDVVLNDPWAPREEDRQVRRICPRHTVIAAWRPSRNTVYLIHPEA